MKKSIIAVLVGITMLVNLTTGCSSKGESTSVAQNQQGITIKGRINYPVEKRFFIEGLNESATAFVPYDTVKLNDDNTFNHFLNLKSPGFYRLNLSGRQAINVILSDYDLEIIADGNNASGFVEIQGSKELDQLRALNTFIQEEFSSKESNLNSEFGQARQTGNVERAQEIQDEYFELATKKELAIMDQIRSMGASLAVIQALNYIDKDKNFTFFDETVQILAKEYPLEPNIIRLKQETDILRVLAIGNEAPEIELPNPDGKLVKLSSLRGNIVLVDFWAEWCKPCRLENPNVVKAYKKYNASGFEVFGVSLDKTRDRWVQAIQDDELLWTQVSDLKYWQSEAALTYNVKAIPASFLLDENGIIIAKNLRGAALEGKLEELFGSKM